MCLGIEEAATAELAVSAKATAAVGTYELAVSLNEGPQYRPQDITVPLWGPKKGSPKLGNSHIEIERRFGSRLQKILSVEEHAQVQSLGLRV